jgi:hypothetical protein
MNYERSKVISTDYAGRWDQTPGGYDGDGNYASHVGQTQLAGTID